MNWGEILQHALFAGSVAAMALGLVFVLAGATGVMRLPDFYTRMHAAGVTDTLGAELIIMGLVLQAQDWQTVAKLLLVGLLLFMTSPTATHAIANAAHRRATSRSFRASGRRIRPRPARRKGRGNRWITPISPSIWTMR